MKQETVGADDLEKYMNDRMEENLQLDGGYYPQSKKDGRSDSLRPMVMKVPKVIRRSNDASYTPKFISIGPIHRDLPELKGAEQLKWRHLHDLIQRSPEENSLGRYLAAVRERVGEARNYYSEEFRKMSDDELVKMLVLDGCFIIEFLIKVNVESRGHSSWIFGGERELLRHDLLLLENQIPFFVLQLLFHNTDNVPEPRFPCNPLASSETLMYYALNYVSSSIYIDRKLWKGKEIHHLLHLQHMSKVHDLKLLSNNQGRKLRWYHPKHIWIYICRALDALIFFVAFILVIWKIPLIKKGTTNREIRNFIPTAAKLEEYGISIRRKLQNEFLNCFMYVSFDEEAGRLEIPSLVLYESSISTICNLIAFELCCLDSVEHYVTAYAILMDHLIDTAEDVAVLEKLDIIKNELGSRQDAVNFFTEISHICLRASIEWRDYLFAVTYFFLARYGLENHCASIRNRLRSQVATTFSQTYGFTPKRWILASIFGTAIVAYLGRRMSILSGIQTAYTVLSNYRP